MAKQGEIDYLQNIGEDGIRHAFDKPFSDEHCATYLINLGAILSLLPPPPAKLLDLGCGTGWTSVFFAKRGYEVTGQDIAPDMIDWARQNQARHGLTNMRFITTDYEALAYDDEFDCAVFYDALHHAVDEKAAIRSVYKALKPGGLVITSEPGVGHSKSPDSIKAMQEWGVTERDMPPSLIIDAAKKAGFKQFQVLPSPDLMHRLCYGRAEGRGLRSKALKFRPFRALAMTTVLFYKTRSRGGLVVLRK